MKLLALFLILLISCDRSVEKKANRDKKTLNVGLSEQVDTLDPANSYDAVSSQVVYQIYEPLFEYHYLKRPYVLGPLLASEMPSVSSNGLIYTIKIKENIKYHPNSCIDENRTVTAQDFVTQIKRLAFKKTQSAGWFLFDGKVKGLNEFREKANLIGDIENIRVEGLKALNPSTLQIILNRPFPQLKYALSMSFTAPIPIEVVKCTNNDLRTVAIGTGPFKLVEWNRGLNIALEKFQKYRKSFYPSVGDRFSNTHKLLQDRGKQIPFLENINFKILKEGQSQWLNFVSGNIDFLPIPKDNYENSIGADGRPNKSLQDKGIKLQVAPTLVYWWLGINMKDPILGKNKNLRMAIATAVNTKKYVELFTNNVGQVANSIYPPGIPGYDPSTELPYSYNIEQAKKYLVRAGYPNGKGLPEFTFDVRGTGTLHRQIGEFIKAELAKIGIIINVQTNTFPGFLKKTREGEMKFWLDGWALDYPDAENILHLLYSKSHAPGPNQTLYDNSEVDALIEKIFLLNDTAEKFSLMKKVEQTVLDDLPWILLYYRRDYILYHDYLKNFRRSELIYNYLKYIRID